MAGIGNGEGVNAALGAIANQVATGKIQEVAESIAREITDIPELQELLSNIITNAAAGGAGYALGGETGGNLAAIMDRFNRELHEKEEKRIAEILSRNPDLEKAKMGAAACALTLCYAQHEEGSEDYKHFKALAEFGASEDCLAEMEALLANDQLLMATPGGYGPASLETLFDYGNLDAIADAADANQVGTRIGGGVQCVFGAIGATGSAVVVLTTSELGVGLVAIGGVVYFKDHVNAGFSTMMSGQPTNTHFVNFLQNDLGLSPEQSAAIDLAMGMGLSFPAALANVSKAGAVKPGGAGAGGKGNLSTGGGQSSVKPPVSNSISSQLTTEEVKSIKSLEL